VQRDWRKKLREDPRVAALDHARTRRRRELSADSMFELRTEALQRQLEEAYAQNPEFVTDFFRQFSWPIAPKLKRLNAFLRKIPDISLRKTLRKYVNHANRFRVIIPLQKLFPHFSKTFELLPSAAKFHVKIVNGQLSPIGSTDEDDPIDISFASDQVEVPRPLDQAIRLGRAKFMRVDDKEGSSCLSILERVAYFPEGISFVLHDAEQPYLLCLIGEKVSVELWRKLSTTVTAMLREEFGRGKAGRPKDLPKRRRAKKLLEKPGPLKEKAAVLAVQAGAAPTVATQQSYLSRLRREQTE
jgi:hypothetical protein